MLIEDFGGVSVGSDGITFGNRGSGYIFLQVII